MHGSRTRRRGLLAAASLALVALAVGGAALAAGPMATTSKVAKVKVRCPVKVVKKRGPINCRAFLPQARGPQGPRGQTGATGRRGAAGPRGAQGAAGVSGYEIVTSAPENVAVPNSGASRGLSAVQTVSCPSGKRVIGGGEDLGGNGGQAEAQRQIAISRSGPNGNGTAWTVQLFNTSSTTDAAIDLRVWAICAKLG
jgi:hypothetical protein